MTWDKKTCECKGSGYISDGSGVAFHNMHPCPNGCGMFEGGNFPDNIFWHDLTLAFDTFNGVGHGTDITDYPDRLLYGELERGEG